MKNKKKPANKKEAENKIYYLPIYMSIGLSIGVGIGGALGNMPLYMCIGLAIGVGVGTALDAANKKKAEKDSDSKDEEDK